MLHACDLYLPSTCYGKDKMRAYTRFEDLPYRRGYGVCFSNPKPSNGVPANWHEVAFRSTNGAYNLRKSLIVRAFDRDDSQG